jgi:hypothetical protein
MLAVRTPEAPQTARVDAAIGSPSPLRDRVGYSDHVRFRGYIPVHFIPAYNLPVYASQRPLPDSTQDSVRGCSLGFAAAIIADGRLQRACKPQLPHHRAYGFVHGGSRSCANTIGTRMAGQSPACCRRQALAPTSRPSNFLALKTTLRLMIGLLGISDPQFRHLKSTTHAANARDRVSKRHCGGRTGTWVSAPDPDP